MKAHVPALEVQIAGLDMLGVVLPLAYEERIPGLDAVVRESHALELMVGVMVCGVSVGA